MRSLRTPTHVDALQLGNFLSTGLLDIVPLNVPPEFHRGGLQNGVTDKLRNGKYPQQASLNFIRQLARICRQMPFSFILQAQQEGLRSVLVIHDKGRGGNSYANIVHGHVVCWLTELDDV